MNERFAYDEIVYDGKVTQVHRIGLKMSDGQVVPRDLVHYGGAAVMLPILDDGSIVLIRNERFAVNECLWELPAGMIDPGESPEACAARELIEETGYTAGRLEKLGQFFSSSGSTDELMYAYLATDLTRGEQDLEVYEQIDVNIVPADRVKQMVVDGTIHDGKTIAALSLYWLKES